MKTEVRVIFTEGAWRVSRVGSYIVLEHAPGGKVRDRLSFSMEDGSDLVEIIKAVIAQGGNQ